MLAYIVLCVRPNGRTIGHPTTTCLPCFVRHYGTTKRRVSLGHGYHVVRKPVNAGDAGPCFYCGADVKPHRRERARSWFVTRYISWPVTGPEEGGWRVDHTYLCSVTAYPSRKLALRAVKRETSRYSFPPEVVTSQDEVIGDCILISRRPGIVYEYPRYE